MPVFTSSSQGYCWKFFQSLPPRDARAARPCNEPTGLRSLAGVIEDFPLSFAPRAEAFLQQLGIPAELVAPKSLLEHQEAETLEVVELGPGGRQHLLEALAAQAWHDLKKNASKAGTATFIVSAYRGVEQQVEILKRKLVAGQSITQVLAVSVPPCFSEHHAERAVDIGTPGCLPVEVEFEETPASQWLLRLAGYFGFLLSYPRGNASGFQYEPWHWCCRRNPNEVLQSTAPKQPGGCALR